MSDRPTILPPYHDRREAVPLGEVPARRWGLLILALAATAAALPLVLQLRDADAARAGLPLWDPAKYGAAGARLADALAGFELGAFVSGVSALSLWPPGFSLLEVPAFLFFGPSEDTALALMRLLFVLAAVAAAMAGWSLRRENDEGAGWIAGALAGGLLLASPAAHLFGSLVMLELPGALVALLALAAYARACRSDSARAWRWAAGLAAALFFVKYNYGLLWLVPLAAGELLDGAGGARALAGRVLAWLRSGALRRASTWNTMAIVALVVAQFLLKGKGITVSGREIRVSPGNILFGLFVIAFLVLVVALLRRDGRRYFRERYARLEVRGRALLGFAALPIGLWLLIPPHLKDLVQFLDNRDTGPSIGTAEGLMFYPRVFLFELSPHPLVGGAVVALAVAAFAGWKRNGRARRTLLLALALQLAAVVLHPYKEGRFLFTIAPLVWLAAALTTADAFSALTRRLLPSLSLRRAVAALLAGSALAAAAGAGVDSPRLAARIEHWSVPADVEPVLEEVVSQALGEGGSVLIGFWNRFSPGLVEWRMRQRERGLDARQIPREPQYFARSRDPARVLDRLASSPEVARVIVLDLKGGSEPAESFRTESSWLDPVREGLAKDPRFRLELSRDFPETGYRLRVYAVAR